MKKYWDNSYVCLSCQCSLYSQLLSPQFGIIKLLMLYSFTAEELKFCWPLKMVKVLSQKGGKKN